MSTEQERTYEDFVAVNLDSDAVKKLRILSLAGCAVLDSGIRQVIGEHIEAKLANPETRFQYDQASEQLKQYERDLFPDVRLNEIARLNQLREKVAQGVGKKVMTYYTFAYGGGPYSGLLPVESSEHKIIEVGYLSDAEIVIEEDDILLPTERYVRYIGGSNRSATILLEQGRVPIDIESFFRPLMPFRTNYQVLIGEEEAMPILGADPSFRFVLEGAEKLIAESSNES